MPATKADKGEVALVAVSANRGRSKPLFVAVISRMALLFGVPVPIPIFCCAAAKKGNRYKKKRCKFFYHDKQFRIEKTGIYRLAGFLVEEEVNKYKSIFSKILDTGKNIEQTNKNTMATREFFYAISKPSLFITI